MCGIAGVFGYPTLDTARRSGQTLQLLGALQHRGPDETRMRSMAEASIGACRLAIVDPETGSQPVTVTCRIRPHVVVLNGEIYNYAELRSSLATPHRFRGKSDTEVLAHLFEEHGINCLKMLNGMFSFCVSDGITSYLARDRLGVKPLYYRVQDGELLFSSEARSLAAKPADVVLEPTYPNFETTLGVQTPFKDVLELPPGHYLVFDSQTAKCRIHQYWNLDNQELEPTNEKAAIDMVRWLVEDAVRLRTSTILPYGCYVSGGLDSTIVAVLAEPQYLFSAVVTDRAYMNEERYVEVLRRSLPSTYREVRSDPGAFERYFVDMVRALDFPSTNLSAFTQYLLSREVGRSGLRIMLSGLGVDEYFGGYARHAAIIARSDPGVLATQFEHYRPLFAKMMGGSPDVSDACAYYRLINRAARTNLAGASIVEQLFASQRSTVNRLAATDMAITFPPLLRCDDRINMRFSIESRSPFLDYRLVEFAFGLDDALKIRRGLDGKISTKYLLRRAFNDIIPARIAERKDKIGFPSPVALWLRNHFNGMVHQAYTIIRETPPLGEIFLMDSRSDQSEFSRTAWQAVQWAAWCLLFVHGLNEEDATTELFAHSNATSVAV